MLTNNVRNQIDAIWNAFWTGGISNPLEDIEQITYLLFLKRLDDLHTLEENKSARLRKSIERRVFPEGNDPKGRTYEDFRWSRFKHFEAKEMFSVVSEHVFPFLRMLGGDNSTYAQVLFLRLRSPPTNTAKTTYLTFWGAGPSAMAPSASARAPRRASACTRRTLSRGATICRSTATGKSSPRKSCTARRAKSLPASANWRRRSNRA